MALLIMRTSQKTIPFDTGQDETFLENARSLGIDLSSVDFMVISHRHYDHREGVEAFLAAYPAIPVYLPVILVNLPGPGISLSTGQSGFSRRSLPDTPIVSSGSIPALK
jgi:7,8-dihydropterin-6-yl-methyl-4-(beta-D-ribofuranosyl)aminobenzene 5'-phosphate synthase